MNFDKTMTILLILTYYVREMSAAVQGAVFRTTLKA